MNVAGVASDADAVAGEGVPLEQARDTFTAAPLFGTKSFETVNVALFCVLTIVHPPVPEGAPVIEPVHGPPDVYPSGTGDSVAVQVAPGV